MSLVSPAPPPWLARCITNLGQKLPHYEASWYGPLNCFLHGYLSPKEGFLIKPQPKLRPTWDNNADDFNDSDDGGDIIKEAEDCQDEGAEEEEEEDILGDYSYDSMGDMVLPRGSGSAKVS
jgi:hypothetical protein